jgi:hypothetical protein
VATGGADTTVAFWDAATGDLRGRFAGHTAGVTALAFGDGGKSAASGAADSTALIWDLSELEAPKSFAANLSAEELDRCWKDLRAGDGAEAYRAVLRLAAAPGPAAELLQTRLKPAAGADSKAVDKLLLDLEDDDFDTREKATEQLAALGPSAEPLLQIALRRGPSFDAKKRIERILGLAARRPISPDQIRERRAVEALERMGSQEARELLQNLAKGAEESTTTQDAKAALARVEKRRTDKP